MANDQTENPVKLRTEKALLKTRMKRDKLLNKRKKLEGKLDVLSDKIDLLRDTQMRLESKLSELIEAENEERKA